jgi:hypothetical protein
MPKPNDGIDAPAVLRNLVPGAIVLWSRESSNRRRGWDISSGRHCLHTIACEAQSRVMEQSSHAYGAPMIREQFDRDGWALVQRFITLRQVDVLRSASDELAAKGAHLLADAEIDGARYEVQTASGRRGDTAVAPGALRKITFASSASVEVALLRSDRRCLKLMESVGATSPRWIVDQINLKAARVGTGFPWHQDVAFVAWQQRDAIAKYGGANLVIGLDRADEVNGGFEVLSGTHARGTVKFDYDTSDTNRGRLRREPSNADTARSS